jgi:hypothetical protein
MVDLDKTDDYLIRSSQPTR